jgi:hypothetical protein
MSEILRAELIADIANFQRNLRAAANEGQRTAKSIESSVDDIANSFTNKLAGAFSVGAITAFANSVIDTTAEFEKFDAVLSNTLSSQALASLKMQELATFAAQTPFGINELTSSFVKLANAGFKPTGEEMTKLGDLASSTGKSFDQLAEAIIDAQTGEFERLKEFGVRAKDAGDSVIFTYKGVQTQVEKTSGSIRDYVTSLGEAAGTSGSMAKISKTLGGQISNLGDNWDQMLLSVGGNTSGIFTSAIDVINKAITKVAQFNKELELNSKYNLGRGTSDFFTKLSRGITTGGVGVTSQLEAMNQVITSTSNRISDFVAKTQRGAKKTSDFGAALATLKRQGDDALRNIKDRNFATALRDVYQTGIRAIQDARVAFANEATRTDSNFGASKGDIDKVAEVYKNLASELKSNPLEFGATDIDIAIANITSYQTAIRGLIDNGFGPASKAITDLKKKQEALIDSFKVGDLEDPKLNINELLGISNTEFKIKPVLKIEPIVVGVNEFLEKVASFGRAISNALEAAMVDGLSGLGDAIGGALATGASVLNAVGMSMLSTLGDLLVRLGKIAIEVGVGLFAIKKAFESLNPVVAIAAGVALVAFGSLIKGKLSGLNGNNQSSQSSGTPRFTAFANGGIVSGPTLGLVGEYAGASNNPEVIAPLNKLRDLLPSNNGEGSVFIPDMRLRGEDIMIAFKRASKRNGGLT